MTDMTMVERVARAIYAKRISAKQQKARSWGELSPHWRGFWTDQARAAIAAMMEPTPKMLAAFDRMCGDDGSCLVKSGYRAMIQAALNEQG